MKMGDSDGDHARKVSLQESKSDLIDAHAKIDAVEEAFRLLFDTVTDYGIFTLSPTGLIQSWNRGAERMKGYRSNEVIGKHFSIFYTEDDRARNHPAHELEIASETGRYEEEGWRVRKDGTRFWANVVITRLVSANGELRGFGKVTRDLTERKRAEDALRSANENLEKRVEERTVALSALNIALQSEVNERLKAEAELQQAVRVRDEFLSIASHELRTPITPLKLQIQSLLAHLRKGSLTELTPERLTKMATSMDQSFNRLGKLVDSLLDVARINAGKIDFHPEEMDAAEVIQETSARFVHEAQRVGSVIAVEAHGPIPVTMDRTRIEQIASNLIVNAIKYGNGNPIHIRVMAHEGWLRLEVRDQGVGISEADLLLIFDRFEQLGRKTGGGGLGLGLYILKQIVDAQLGKIHVESESGKGSLFRVELPMQANKSLNQPTLT